MIEALSPSSVSLRKFIPTENGRVFDSNERQRTINFLAILFFHLCALDNIFPQHCGNFPKKSNLLLHRFRICWRDIGNVGAQFLLECCMFISTVLEVSAPPTIKDPGVTCVM